MNAPARVALALAIVASGCTDEPPAPPAPPVSDGGGGGAGGATAASTTSATSSGSGAGAPGGGAPHPDNGPKCPEVRPEYGDSCQYVGPETCIYTSGCSDTGCEVRCIADAWLVSCEPCEVPPVACPAETPLHQAYCPQPMDKHHWCFYDRCDEGGFAWAQCRGEAWEVNHSLCAFPTPGCMGQVGESPINCMDNTLCIKSSVDPPCTPHPSWDCPPNPCIHEPLSCACAGTICGPFLECVDVTPGGWVTCELPPPGPNPPVKLSPVGGADLTINDTHAYFGGSYSYLRVPLIGGEVETFVTIDTLPARFAVNDTHFFLAEAGVVKRIDLADSQQEVIAAGTPDPYGIDTNGSLVLFRSLSTTYTVPADGGTLTLLANASGPMVLDVSHAFIFDWGIKAWPLGGGNFTLVTPEMGTNLAVDGTHIYFTQKGATPTTGKVFKVPKAGGPATVLADNQYEPTGIAVDDTHVYFSRADHLIMRVAKNGGPSEIFVAGHPLPHALAVDATHLYWADLYDATCRSVWKKAK